MEVNKNKIYYYVANISNSIYRPLRRTLVHQQLYSSFYLSLRVAQNRSVKIRNICEIILPVSLQS